jgi:hypothetical protein
MNNIQISKRVMAALRRAGVNDLRSLSSLPLHQVSQIPGIGAKGCAEIEAYLSTATTRESKDFSLEVAEIDRLMLRLDEFRTALIASSVRCLIPENFLIQARMAVCSASCHPE